MGHAVKFGLLLWLAAALRAAPFLTLEVGDHLTDLQACRISPDNRLVATVGRDRTVRIWSIPRLEPVRVIRLPQPGLPDLALTDVCFSADSRRVAIIGQEDANSNRFREYDLATGDLLCCKRFAAAMLKPLTRAPDGYLGASVGGSWLFPTDARPVTQLFEFPLGGSGLAWTSDGTRCAMVLGGKLLIRDRQGATLATVASVTNDSGGGYTLAWSPDHQRIAFGRQSAGPAIVFDVAQGRALNVLPVPFCGDLAFSPDGRSLCIGEYKTVVFDLQTGQQTAAFGDRASHSVDWSADGQHIATGDALALYAVATGQVVRPRPRAQSNWFYGVGWSADGQRLAFSDELGGQPPSSMYAGTTTLHRAFDWVNLAVVHLTGKSDEYRRPVLKAGDAEVVRGAPRGANGMAATAFLRAGRELVRWENDGVGTLLPDGRAAFADYFGLHIEPGGHTVPAHAGCSVYGIAGTADGRLLATCAFDYRIRTWAVPGPAKGAEPLATLYLTRDDDWVAWTQEGYYACSPGARRLLGFQIDHGVDANPDYLPLSQFGEALYRPDVISRLVTCGSVADALQQANEARGKPGTVLVDANVEQILPPKAAILQPAGNAVVTTANAEVLVSITDANRRKIASVVALVNGRPCGASRFVFVPVRGPDTWSATVPLTPGRNVISIIATNDAGAASEPVSVTVSYGQAELVKPSLYVLAVGISAYEDKTFNLAYAAKDAKDLATAWQAQSGKLFAKVESKVLTDADATVDAVTEGLDWLGKQVTSRDYAMVFLAGHGVADSRGDYYFLPVDGKPDKLMRTAVPWSQVRSVLKAVPGKVLLAVDTCHSGGVTGARALSRRDYAELLRDAVTDEVGLITFASCLPHEVSLEDEAWRNGALTKAITEGLAGPADLNQDGVVTLAELDAYIAERVKALTGGRQHATTDRPTTIQSTLPLAVVK